MVNAFGEFGICLGGFNALMQMWKTVPPLESKVKWIQVGRVLGGAEIPKKLLDELTEAKSSLQSVLNEFGPFVDVRIYETLQKTVAEADRERMKGTQVKGMENFSLADLAGTDEFGNLRQELFKAIAIRIKELSQYDQTA